MKFIKKRLKPKVLIKSVSEKTEKIKAWLYEKNTESNWKQEGNPNCFTNERLQALYIYGEYIKYWEDIRAKDVVEKHEIPKNREDLYSIINKNKSNYEVD